MPIGQTLKPFRLPLTWPNIAGIFDGKTAETSQAKGDFAYGVAALVLLVAIAAVALYFMRPPRVVSAASPASVFSAERAMKHVEAIAANPHPIGSAEHARVRDYIVAQLTAQGFETSVSNATAFSPIPYKPFRAATVQNIIGRLRGTGGDKAVMLMAHYDSVPTGPGASDDGAGVAALLETARALKAHPPLKNDVVILLTDGEEIGLMGSSAFVDEQRGAMNIGAVFNFEARGSSGQSVMFETSEGNGWLIEQFAKASPAPVGNSLMYEIYKLLPNDTDFSTFKRAGYAGLNFAYINDLPRYHTATDNIQNLDAGSLQHHGANALALARHFGNLDFAQAGKENAVYFNPIGAMFVRYPASLVLPLTLIVLLVFVSVTIVGLKKRLLTWRGMGLGALMMLVAGVMSYVTVTATLWVMKVLLRGEELVPWGEPYNSGYYVWSLVAVSAAAMFATLVLFRRWARAFDVAMGASFWWMILALLTSLLIPGGSYLFVWPLLFALIGLGVRFLVKDERPSIAIAVSTLCAIPAIFLIVPVINTLFTALTFNAANMILLSLVLLLGLLIPALELAVSAMKWRVTTVALWFGLFFLSAGLLTFGFDANHPKMSSVFYGLNADSGRAVWATYDPQPDEWTSQFFRSGVRQATLKELFPSSNFPVLQSDAPAAMLAAPELTVVDDKTEGDSRFLRLRVASPRGAEVVSLFPDAKAQIVNASINGKQIDQRRLASDQGPWSLQYFGLPREGAEIALELKQGQPLTIRVTDRSYGLPQLTGVTIKPRPDYMVLPPSSPGEMTLVGKAFTF